MGPGRVGTWSREPSDERDQSPAFPMMGGADYAFGFQTVPTRVAATAVKVAV